MLISYKHLNNISGVYFGSFFGTRKTRFENIHRKKLANSRLKSRECASYFSKDKKEIAGALIQKKYDEKILMAAQKQYKNIHGFLEDYDPDSIRKVFQNLTEARKPFVIPVELPDEDYIKEWEARQYERKGFLNDAPEHYTKRNERVRSKSEVLIADALLDAGLPYRYEYPIWLGDQIIHPDFTILRISDRKEVYWEHLGLLDDTYYRNDAVARINLYEKNGIFLGDRLIVTIETYKQPLNVVTVNAKIRHHFL